MKGAKRERKNDQALVKHAGKNMNVIAEAKWKQVGALQRQVEASQMQTWM